MEVFPREIQKLITSFGVPYNMFFELVKAEMHLRWFSATYVDLGRFVDDGSKNFVRLKRLPKFIVNNLPHGITMCTLVAKKLTAWELVGNWTNERSWERSPTKPRYEEVWDWSEFFSNYLEYSIKCGCKFEDPSFGDPVPITYIPKIRHTTRPTNQEPGPGDP